ncbi:MAG: hypothetical protein U5Q03_18410 [Bacteroidota bacterium]|nr:hypothetical protein [Bacteroidota bacterium]
MSDLKLEITSWLHDQANWLQESAEKILEKGNLDLDDIRELIALVKTDEGQKKSNNRRFQGLSASQSKGAQLHIESIGEIKGIDTLSPRYPLTFGDGNLAVIYGHNGSGKSGYARILKKVCGKPRAKELKSNIFQKQPVEQSCTIKYEINGHKNSVKWKINDSPISDLLSVDIFDRDEAGFYLTGETIVSYTPSEVSLFEKLAQVCDRIRLELQDEQDKLVSKMPNLASKFSATKIGKIYNSISAGISQTVLSELTEWTADNRKNLEQLKERLKGTDPNKLAASKGKRKETLDKLYESIKKAYNELDSMVVDRLQSLKRLAYEKRKTATEGAKAQTQTAKLEGIGSETWRALWEAAKEYSIKEAYPERSFL